MALCDYFSYLSAMSDEIAVAVLDEPGGPDAAAFDVLSLKGIGPLVAMARLEGILTDRAHDEARARPRSGELLSGPEAEGALVIRVSGALRDAPASASDGQLGLAEGQFAAVEEVGLPPAQASNRSTRCPARPGARWRRAGGCTADGPCRTTRRSGAARDDTR
jgi:hypothetical protein